MLHTLLIQLEDPLYDLALAITTVLLVAAARTIRRDPSALRRLVASRAVNFIRRQGGQAQLAQQSVSSTITIVISAFAVAAIGYVVLQLAWTGICSGNLAQIAAAEDLRFTRGYGYTANGNVTAAAFVDADNQNDYMRNDPHDPAGPKTGFYTFTATQTNGDWTYTISDYGTHAGFTTLNFQNGASTKTALQYVGPGGVVSAH
jgi:hypothetical protein